MKRLILMLIIVYATSMIIYAQNDVTLKHENGVDMIAGSVQCNGFTKAGARCKNKTLNTSGYCYLHEEQINNKSLRTSPSTTTKPRSSNNSNSKSVQCSGTTNADNRCKRMTSSSSRRCYQH